jgi:alpha-amylase
MPFINFCLRINQPYPLRTYSPLDVEQTHCYIDEEATINRLDELSAISLLAVLRLLKKLITQHKNKFNISFSVSGIMLEQLEKFRPDVLNLLQKMVKTGNVEILGETFNNSLSSLYSEEEFKRQVSEHKNIVQQLFQTTPVVFRNTELIHNNHIAALVAEMGFKGILCEAVDRMLNGRTRNNVFYAPLKNPLPLLLRNHRMSDDIAFHFDNKDWNEYPLTAEKFAGWVHSHEKDADVINLFFDIQTFGMYKTAATGIFDFLSHLPGKILENENWVFAKPSQVISQCSANQVYDVKETISWEDKTEDCCVWCKNTMQHNMLNKIYKMEKLVKMSRDENILKTWERLQAADYFYYMSDRKRKTGDIYQVMNPYPSASDAYRNFLNIITDFEIQVIRKGLSEFKPLYPTLSQTILY